MNTDEETKDIRLTVQFTPDDIFTHSLPQSEQFRTKWRRNANSGPVRKKSELRAVINNVAKKMGHQTAEHIST